MVLVENLMHCWVSSLLNYKQDKVISNSFISGQFNYCHRLGMFSSIRSYNKLHEGSLQLCQNDYTLSYNKLLSIWGLVHIHKRNIQQLIIEILKCLRSLSPSYYEWDICVEKYPIYHKKSRKSQQSLVKDCVLCTWKYNIQRTTTTATTICEKSGYLESFRQNIPL